MKSVIDKLRDRRDRYRDQERLCREMADELDMIIAEMKKEAPQLEAEEQKKVFDEWYQKAVKATVRELHRIADS